MEMIEDIVWVMAGFMSTPVTMELSWRLAKGQTRNASFTNPIAMKQEVELQ